MRFQFANQLWVHFQHWLFFLVELEDELCGDLALGGRFGIFLSYFIIL